MSDELVTVAIPTYNIPDFTKACVASMRRWFGGEIMLFNGASDSGVLDIDNITIYNALGANSLEAINMIPERIRTKYVLLCDNDTKMTRNCIPEMVKLLEDHEDVGMTGAYACKVIDWKKHRLAFSTIFSSHMEVDAFICWFVLIRTEAWRKVAPWQIESLYPDVPHYLLNKGSAVDMRFTHTIKEAGWRLVSPARDLGVLHWLHGSGRVYDDAFGKWWAANTDHRRVDPLNAWDTIDWSRPCIK